VFKIASAVTKKNEKQRMLLWMKSTGFVLEKDRREAQLGYLKLTPNPVSSALPWWFPERRLRPQSKDAPSSD
jgi:hypothetical protein